MIRFALGLATVLWAGAAVAGDTLGYGPPAAWVKDIPLPPTPTTDDSPGARILDLENQVRIAPSGEMEIYGHFAAQITTPQALALGNFSLAWDPARETMTINRFHLIRDGKVIDVLATQKFTVLRREANLERSMLDGRLTATIQPEGVQVGDILDIGFTRVRKDPTFRGHVEYSSLVPPDAPIEHIYERMLWPATTPVRWRASPSLTPAVITKTADGQEFVIDMTKVKLPKAVTLAPPRFVLNSSFELSDYASWNELSAVLAPLFDKASTLAPDSPLKAEAAKIKAASTDPKVRAAAAFHLVEEQVRYVFLGMDLGGYVPADADVTWTRRFGDCKGKTVLLLALLRELDIKAQPAMVSTRLGDALPERLPGVELFNHVIVKAEIGGKIYWLDGTRSGDGDIDNLYTPDFRNDLPLSDAGADLEAMPIAPLDRPLIEDHWTIDATAGVNAPAPIHIETIRRGDLGVTEGLTSEHQTAADEEASIRKDWAASHRWIEIKKVSFSFDRAKGEFHKVIDGAASLEWDFDASAGALRYETDNTYLGEKTAYKRTEGPLDAPFAIFHPFASTYTETILLPRGGKGFSVVGADVNQDIPGEEYRRKAHIENGKLTTETSERSTAFEITSAQADDARVAERVLSNVTVYLQTPPGYADGPAEKALRLARKPETESEFRDHADALFDKGDYDG